MNLTLTIAGLSHRDLWDQTVQASPQGSLFHLWDWLSIVEDFTRTELCPLLVYRGSTLVALYPLFFGRKGPFRVAFSPPPQAYLYSLGPVIPAYESMKQEKKESIFLQIQKDVTEYIFGMRGCTFTRIRPVPEIADSRPFRWTGYDIEPLYTYRLDLTQGTDRIWAGFNKNVRDSIKKAEKKGISIQAGGTPDLDYLLQSLAQRYSEQGYRPWDSSQYIRSLWDRFSPDNLKIYTAWYEGERVGGFIATSFRSWMGLWIGVPKSTIPGIAPNDLVQWHAIQEAIHHGYRYFEFMDGGDNERLRFFKSKFNPDLVPWYSASRFSSLLMKFAVQLMKKGI